VYAYTGSDQQLDYPEREREEREREKEREW